MGLLGMVGEDLFEERGWVDWSEGDIVGPVDALVDVEAVFLWGGLAGWHCCSGHFGDVYVELVMDWRGYLYTMSCLPGYSFVLIINASILEQPGCRFYLNGAGPRANPTNNRDGATECCLLGGRERECEHFCQSIDFVLSIGFLIAISENVGRLHLARSRAFETLVTITSHTIIGTA